MAIVNKTDLAEILGLTLKGVDDMVRRGCPYVRKGSGRGREWQFDTAAVREWREDRIRAEQETSRPKVVNLEHERLLKLAAERALAELELARVSGEMVRIDQVVETVDQDYANVRARILLIPNKLAPRVPRIRTVAEARKLLHDELREVLHELSSGTEIARDLTGGDPPIRRSAGGRKGEEPPTSA